jgi:uncharacterized membrane protein
MIGFLQLPYRHRDNEPERRDRTRSLLVGFTMGLVLASQIGLLVWAMFR